MLKIKPLSNKEESGVSRNHGGVLGFQEGLTNRATTRQMEDFTFIVAWALKENPIVWSHRNVMWSDEYVTK